MTIPSTERRRGPPRADLDASLRARAERALGGRRIVEATIARGGYTPAARWRVRLDDGRTAFVKGAVNDLTAGWLRSEHRLYEAVSGPFLPRLLGWDDDGVRPVIVLEDLSSERWPPPWGPGDTESVVTTLERVHATPGLDWLRAASDLLAFDGWARVALDPQPFLGTGLATAAWLDRALPALLATESAFDVRGDALLHLDVRSDNLCLRPGTAVLVDWNHACRGNPVLDVAFWLPSLELEGGPAPEAILPQPGDAAVVVSGFLAARAGLPAVADAPGVRPIQLAQLRPALQWAARVHDLPPPGLG